MYSRKYIRSGGQSVSPRAEGRVSLPPDYTGTAFIPEPMVRPEDFPETVIPTAPPKEDDSAIDLPAESEPLSSSDTEPDSFNPEPTDPPTPDDGLPQPSVQASTEQADVPPVATANEVPAEQETPPLLTAELLRSLTLEDLLLYWLLLMLLTCQQEDQIYLLLGLLLIQR